MAINAKYIHTSPAVRLLDEAVDESYSSSFVEFAIKDEPMRMVDTILSYKPLIVGFSCYIWNITIVLEIARILKEENSNIIILLGGPEVSYDTESFINLPYIDYIASGEGETIINPFIIAVKSNIKVDLPSIASKDNTNVKTNIVKDLNDVPSIIHTYTQNDLNNKIIYFETSRGCPFNCEYCISSLELGVRSFPFVKIEKELEYLISNSAKTIKFLDRTFNFDKKRFMHLVKYLESVGKDHTFQFEITLDLFDEELISYFENEVTPNMFRFEIGIQSIHDDVNLAVSRKQNIDKLFDYIRRLLKGRRVTLHLDLIVGLPYETYEMAIESFEKVFMLFPQELQLGFLKMLRGTSLRKNALAHGYTFDDYPPYEIVSNKYMSVEQVENFRLVEEALDIYYNKERAVSILEYLIKNKMDSSFELFLNLGTRLRETKITDAYDYYQILIDVIKKMKYFDKTVSDLFIYTYLYKYPIRPKIRQNIKMESSTIREYLSMHNDQIKSSTHIMTVNYQDGYLVLCYLKKKVYYYYLVIKDDSFIHELLSVKQI